MTDVHPTPASGPDAAPPPRRTARVIVASVVGTSIEWYDFFLYGTAAALVFNKLFFPTLRPARRHAAGLRHVRRRVRRPAARRRHLRALRRPHRPQERPRRHAAADGRRTLLIGLLPTYDDDRRRGAGPAGGAALPAGPRRRRRVGRRGADGAGARRPAPRGLYASWPQVGVPVGQLLAAGVLAAAQRDAHRGGVPVLGLAGAVPARPASLIAVGLWIRLTVVESPVFARGRRSGRKARAADRGAHAPPAGPAHRDGRPHRHRRRVLHLHAVHPHLRHHRARPAAQRRRSTRCSSVGAASSC